MKLKLILAVLLISSTASFAQEQPCTAVFNCNRIWNPHTITFSGDEWICAKYDEIGACIRVMNIGKGFENYPDLTVNFPSSSPIQGEIKYEVKLNYWKKRNRLVVELNKRTLTNNSTVKFKKLEGSVSKLNKNNKWEIIDEDDCAIRDNTEEGIKILCDFLIMNVPWLGKDKDSELPTQQEIAALNQQYRINFTLIDENGNRYHTHGEITAPVKKTENSTAETTGDENTIDLEALEAKAMAGDASAQNDLGKVYLLGDGANVDYGKALKWLKKSAYQENSNSQYWLGIMYLKGYSVTKDYEDAQYWFKKSAEQDDDLGQCGLGIIYFYGLGVSKDYEKALIWFQKSAEQGNTVAQNNLGSMYIYGNGVAKNYEKAISWVRKSAEQGSAIGQGNLGKMYEYGYGVDKSIEKAKEWYQKACDNGNESGCDAIKRLQ
jgi:hypothetical protein